MCLCVCVRVCVGGGGGGDNLWLKELSGVYARVNYECSGFPHHALIDLFFIFYFLRTAGRKEERGMGPTALEMKSAIIQYFRL